MSVAFQKNIFESPIEEWHCEWWLLLLLIFFSGKLPRFRLLLLKWFPQKWFSFFFTNPTVLKVYTDTTATRKFSVAFRRSLTRANSLSTFMVEGRTVKIIPPRPRCWFAWPECNRNYIHGLTILWLFLSQILLRVNSTMFGGMTIPQSSTGYETHSEMIAGEIGLVIFW